MSKYNQTHCKRCGQLTNIDDAKLVQYQSTKIVMQKDVLANLSQMLASKTGTIQALNLRIKQLIELMPQELRVKAKELIAQPKRRIE